MIRRIINEHSYEDNRVYLMNGFYFVELGSSVLYSQMSVRAEKVIDVRGRLWVNQGKKLTLSEENLPKLNPYQILYNDIHNDKFLLAEDGAVYNLDTLSIVEIPHIIKSLVSLYKENSFIALTDQERLIKVNTGDGIWIESICDNISYLLNSERSNYIKILMIDNQGTWRSIRYQSGDIILDDDVTPEGFQLEEIISVKRDNLVCKNNYIKFASSGTSWFIKLIDIPNILDVTQLQEYVGRNERCFDIIITNSNELMTRRAYPEKRKICEYEHLSEHRWIRLVDIFKKNDRIVGLVNEIGEIYKLNRNFMSAPTNLPTEIYALPPTKVKNARNK